MVQETDFLSVTAIRRAGDNVRCVVRRLNLVLEGRTETDLGILPSKSVLHLKCFCGVSLKTIPVVKGQIPLSRSAPGSILRAKYGAARFPSVLYTLNLCRSGLRS